MALKVIRASLFFLFNIGFAVAIFMLLTWLNEIQVKADAQNKEYKIGEIIPLGDIEIVLTDADLALDMGPPEIPDPYLEFGGRHIFEDCTLLKPIKIYNDCTDRNRMRERITVNLSKYRRDRLSISYTVKTTNESRVDLIKTTPTIDVVTTRDVEEPFQVTKNISFNPYGVSTPVIKNDGKVVDRQMWVDVLHRSESAATVTFTYDGTMRKIPISVTELAEKNS